MMNRYGLLRVPLALMVVGFPHGPFFFQLDHSELHALYPAVGIMLLVLVIIGIYAVDFFATRRED